MLDEESLKSGRGLRRHEFLKTLEHDYENGCFGSGQTEKLIEDLVEREIKFMEANFAFGST